MILLTSTLNKYYFLKNNCKKIESESNPASWGDKTQSVWKNTEIKTGFDLLCTLLQLLPNNHIVCGERQDIALCTIQDGFRSSDLPQPNICCLVWLI